MGLWLAIYHVLDTNLLGVNLYITYELLLEFDFDL